MIEAAHVLEAQRILVDQRHAGHLLELFIAFEGRALDDIHLALGQRVHLRLRVAQREVPLHALDIHMLAARGAGGRFPARLVFLILHIHRFVARSELVALEEVGTAADRLLDLLVGGRVGEALGHDERHIGRGLAQRLEHEAAGLAQENAELVRRRRVHALDEAHELLAHRVALAPALQGGDDVFAGHGFAVMEFEPFAQREAPQALIRAHAPLVHHLRLHPALLVGAEQRVVHHVAMVAGHVLRGPDRVEDVQVGVRHDA